jgi:hypothetical protein
LTLYCLSYWESRRNNLYTASSEVSLALNSKGTFPHFSTGRIKKKSFIGRSLPTPEVNYILRSGQRCDMSDECKGVGRSWVVAYSKYYTGISLRKARI